MSAATVHPPNVDVLERRSTVPASENRRNSKKGKAYPSVFIPPLGPPTAQATIDRLVSHTNWLRGSVGSAVQQGSNGSKETAAPWGHVTLGPFAALNVGVKSAMSVGADAARLNAPNDPTGSAVNAAGTAADGYTMSDIRRTGSNDSSGTNDNSSSHNSSSGSYSSTTTTPRSDPPVPALFPPFAEVTRRDRLHRDYLLGCDWDKGPEHHLVRNFILQQQRNKPWLLPGGRSLNFPYIWDYEWEVEPGASHKGKGDLLLTDGVNDFLVMEFKWLTVDQGGSARRKRNKARTEVATQAVKYAAAVRRMFPSCGVTASIKTNEENTILSDNGERELDMKLNKWAVVDYGRA